MKIGIVGFAGSGKTTLFNALTGRNIQTEFSDGKVNLGTIKVPDARVDRLAEIEDPRKVTYAEITFADIPGGRSSGSIEPKVQSQMRELDTLVQVVRGFDDGMGVPDPSTEYVSFLSELIIADMGVAEKRVERLKKDRSDMRQLTLLERCLEHMGNELPLFSLGLSDDECATLSGFAFLSLKPLMLLVSVSEDKVTDSLPESLRKLAEEKQLTALSICGSIEAEIAGLDPADQGEFLQDVGLTEPASVRFIRSAFGMLDLISFLTHGPDECRAWPIRRGSTAVDAAGVIHSDIARGFIRAEVTKFSDFDELESEAACRDAGKFRVEGKDYIVQDGDICHFRFNV